MSMNYVERFEIPGGGSYLISKKTNGFQVWHGGCAIGKKHKTMDGAWAYIHVFALCDLSRNINELTKRIITFDNSRKLLAEDKFNLGWFRQKV
jgi:hypothetical protein